MTKHVTLTATCPLSSTLSLLAVFTLFTCSNPDHATTDGGTDDGGPAQCAAGLKAVGPACVPIFDECKGDEIPVLGGGCRHVGPPKTCLTGWARVKGGWCEPIRPKGKCPIGTMEVIGKTTCQPVGPPIKCLTGWTLVGGGWCEPILPQGKCPAGTMEVIGKATCQPIGDCGTGTLGKIKTTASTIFVNQSYAGGSSDGSQTKPFLTIAAALYNATAGDHIAVSSGTYKENISVERKVTLEGRCAEKVTIAGGSSGATVVMTKWASGAVLRGVTISGAGVGLHVDGVTVTVERVAVRGCEGRGIEVDNGGDLALRDSVVAGSREVGVMLSSAKATLERTVVRDSRELASNKQAGLGLSADVQAGKNQMSELTLRDCLVTRNRTLGIYLSSSRAKVERSVIRDTIEQASDSNFGGGIEARIQAGKTQMSKLELQDSLVTDNRNVGIYLSGSSATLDRSVVRGTRERVSDKNGGVGIQMTFASSQGKRSQLTMRHSLVTQNRTIGLHLTGSTATLERSVVSDTQMRASDKNRGTGVLASMVPGQSKGSEVNLRYSLVSGNRTVGIALSSSKATLEHSVVRGTREQASDKKGGYGIQGSVKSGQGLGSDLILRDSLVSGNRSIGIQLDSSKATVQRSVVRGTSEQASDGKYGGGIEASLQADQKQGSVLILTDSLVADNRTSGVVLVSSKATVDRSTVCNTGAQVTDNKSGVGIQAYPQSGESPRPELTMRDSLVAANRTTGLFLDSSKVTVERSVVRDTRRRASDGKYGAGIAAGVDENSSLGTTLTLHDSLVAGNRESGVAIFSSTATVRGCEIRGTREQASDKRSGFGFQVGVQEGYKQGSVLKLSNSQVSGNRAVGILAGSSKITVDRSVVRDTREQASDQQAGQGIQVRAALGRSKGSELTLRDSLVAKNRFVGVFLLDSTSTVERCVVRDTREVALDKNYGLGIYADVVSSQSQGSVLTLRQTVVANNLGVGVNLLRTKATMSGSIVRDTHKGVLGYGDGIAVGKKSTLHVTDTTVESNDRSGFLFHDSGGSVHRCVIRFNVFSVDLEQNSRPTIGKDNTIVDNKENDVTSRSLPISPSAKSPLP